MELSTNPVQEGAGAEDVKVEGLENVQEGAGAEDVKVEGVETVRTDLGGYQDVFKVRASAVTAVAFSPDNKFLAYGSGSNGNAIRVVELATGKEEKFEGPLGSRAGISVAWHPDGKSIVSGSGDNTVRVWNVETKEEVFFVGLNRKRKKEEFEFKGHTESVTCAAFDKTGDFIASASRDQTVRVWTVATKEVKVLQHDGSVNSISWSPTSHSLVSAGRTISIWDVAAGSVTRTLEGHARSVAWSPDGQRIASGSKKDDETVRIWDAESGEVVSVLKGHTDGVNSVAWDPTSTLVVLSSYDSNTVRVWDVAAETTIKTIHGHSDSVYGVAWSSDGTSIASGSGDDTAMVTRPAEISGSGKAIAEGLRQQSPRLVEDAIVEMPAEGVNFFRWLESLKDDVKFPELAMLFETFWDVMEAKSASPDATDKALGERLQATVKQFIADVKAKAPDLLPELVQVVPTKQLQKLAGTRVMQTLVYELSKTGAMKVYKVEVVVYCVFLVCLTRTSYICKFAATVDEVTGNASHMAWVVSTVVLASAFIVREAMQIAAARKIGTTSAYFWSFWNFVDLASASLAIATIASFLASGPGETFNHLASVTAFFMWLKLLGLIKALNKQVATFVLMLSNILADIRAFLFVMLLVVIMFGHALFMVLGTRDEGVVADITSAEGGPATISDWESSAPLEDLADGLYGGWETKFDTIAATGVTLYSMLLGDYDPDQFPTTYAYAISVVFMFIIVIVMLNVLIAIVSDSYDNAMVKSTELFWLARLELVAEVSTTFKNTIGRIDYKKMDEWAQNKAKEFEVEGRVFDAWPILVRLTQIDNEGPTAWPIRILYCPISLVIVPSLLFYEFVIVEGLLQPFTAKLAATAILEVKLKLFNPNFSDDGDWSGRVLDIVRRINSNTNEASLKQLSALKAENEEIRAECREMKEMMAAMMKMMEKSRR